MTIRVDGYEDVTPLGRGGFSQVYRARQVEFDRWVAIKVLDVGLDHRQRESFERECRAMGVVSQHPNIVTVLSAAFTDEGRPAIVMELYGGGSYADRVKRGGRLPATEVLEVGIRISGALQSAHDRGLLHRDVKPQNLFVSDYGEPALGDFGISSFGEEDTVGGALSVHYVAPEVIEYQRASASSDVYSLAVTLYVLASGRRPFATPGQRQSKADVLLRVRREPPPRIGGDCPPQLERAILQAMAKQPEDRPASAASFGRLLQAAQEGIGYGRTELAVAQAGSDHADDLTIARDHAHAPGLEDDESATMARPLTVTSSGSAIRDAADTGGSDAAPGRRVATSVAAGVVAVAAVLGAGIWAVQRDTPPADDGEVAVTEPDPDVAADDFFVRVEPPDDVTLARDNSGEVAVSWTPVEGLSYEVERVDGGADDRWSTDDGEVVLDAVGADERPCVVVRALNADGQLSPATSPTCLGD